MIQHKCSDRMPDSDRHVLVYDKPFCGELWYPAMWKGDEWVLCGFGEDELDELEVTHWMEMDFDINTANKTDSLFPSDDRYVLILAEAHFGAPVWHPAAWLGKKDDEPGGDISWAITGLGYTETEVAATHWVEMPPMP